VRERTGAQVGDDALEQLGSARPSVRERLAYRLGR